MKPAFFASLSQGGRNPAQPFADLTHLRQFLTGNGIFALFDAPWVPLYVLVIALMNPLIGWIATMGGVVLFALAYLNERYTREPLKESGQKSMAAMRLIDSAHRNAEVVGSEFAGRVALIPLLKGRSTTALARKMGK